MRYDRHQAYIPLHFPNLGQSDCTFGHFTIHKIIRQTFCHHNFFFLSYGYVLTLATTYGRMVTLDSPSHPPSIATLYAASSLIWKFDHPHPLRMDLIFQRIFTFHAIREPIVCPACPNSISCFQDDSNAPRIIVIAQKLVKEHNFWIICIQTNASKWNSNATVGQSFQAHA